MTRRLAELAHDDASAVLRCDPAPVRDAVFGRLVVVTLAAGEHPVDPRRTGWRSCSPRRTP